MLCPWAMSFSQKSCPAPFPPVSCSFPEPHRGPQCCLYSLLEGQPENSWPSGEKSCTMSSPSRCPGLHLPCFLQHVQQQHLSGDPLGQVTGTPCLLEVHLLVASLQGQLGFQGWCLPLWELARQAFWAQTLTTLLLKLQTYSWIKSPLHFCGTSGLLPHQFVIKPLTNCCNQDPAPLQAASLHPAYY